MQTQDPIFDLNQISRDEEELENDTQFLGIEDVKKGPVILSPDADPPVVKIMDYKFSSHPQLTRLAHSIATNSHLTHFQLRQARPRFTSANSMALSSYPALNWSVGSNQYHWRFIASPQVAVKAPHPLTATAFPTYSNFNTSSSRAHSLNNSKRLNGAVKADPSFFRKGCWEYNISSDDELIDGHSYVSCQEYCDNYNTNTYDDILNPAAATYFTHVAETPMIGSCYEISDHQLQQQLSFEPEFLSLQDNYGMNLDQLHHCQAPSQSPKRHKPCYIDLPDSLFPPNNPHPTVQLPPMQKNGISSKVGNNLEDMEQTRPTRRVSAQSQAARERRKKIADKTHELGKLIPGGSKMNTAEMLQSAFKYVKFLQSQIHVLQLISSLNPSQVPNTANNIIKLA
ncbi:hypothetical protein SAY87_005567 [Trapa incisa]|uniref:BHLH domain-containing protein n=1 Tax=Trapa incisa TaxID=236973 RepID=A0AAN7K6C4_9MYRT|nr:hypothetical protein SAY87_005567 [Trapa incisa]